MEGMGILQSEDQCLHYLVPVIVCLNVNSVSYKIILFRFNWSHPDYAELAATPPEAMEEFLSLVRPPQEHTFSTCKVHRKLYNCDDILTNIKTDAGMAVCL